MIKQSNNYKEPMKNKKNTAQKNYYIKKKE